MMNPAIAILLSDTLAGIGLSGIIQRMMPGAEIVLYSSFSELEQDPEAQRFFHYFVSTQVLLSSAAYFLKHQRKTIVVVHGNESRLLPKGFHFLNAQQSEKELVHQIMALANQSHAAHGQLPDIVRMAQRPVDDEDKTKAKLTARECDVLRGVVQGMINKEIADQLGVSVATVITHRKNLVEKLGIRSVSALTIYAVTHGIVHSNEI